MKLSKNFTLEELLVTGTGLPNNPGKHEIENLIELTTHVLQPLRDIYGSPIHVNSGFRCKAVNQKVGGVTTSQHTTGEAADISCDNNARLFHIIREKLVFDQLIWEGGDDSQPAWVHVSYKSQGNRAEVLKMKNGKYIRL
jgi:hypothetical protein